MKTKQRLSDKLKETNQVPHPFILQCVHQKCCEVFSRKIELLDHLRNDHGLGEAAVAKFDIYALTQLFHEDTIWWKDNSETVKLINGYWPDKKDCIFDNCKFDHLTIAYNHHEHHTEYYLKEIIGIEDITRTRVRIFNALAPVWKCMV
jgi:hypothetical protein